MWRRIVVTLHDLGDRYLELHGEQVDRFLADLPDATYPLGPPRPEAAASARRSEAQSTVKVADAARRTPETSPGVLRYI